MTDVQASRYPDLKIWIVAPVPPPYGGMSLQGENLARKLSAEGLAVEVIPTNASFPRALQAIERIPGVRTLVREVLYLWSLRAVLRHRGVIHHLSASYLFFFLHSVPLLLFARLSGNRLVFNYRGGKAGEFLRTWSWFVVPVLRGADQVAVPSEYLQDVFRRYGVASTVVPNIADTEAFSFRERTQFAPRLLVTRHLEPMYDIECVLRAFRRVQENVPDASLGIAGDGIECERLQALVREWGLRGVTFYGAVAYADLPALYSQYDIYMNGSRVDNFPGALVEAACAGLPIVTTRAGGIAEMIQHRRTGLLADVGDDTALANGVLELLRRPEFACDLAANARHWAELFSWRSVFPQLLRAYGIAEPISPHPLEPQTIAASRTGFSAGR
jgi:L-malate glycosyltransferase